MPEMKPLTPGRWGDLEKLFGPERGANSGCWCQWTRIARKEWDHLGREGRKERLRTEVRNGSVPGLIAYEEKEAVGWCAIAPRRATPRFNASRITKPVAGTSDETTWAITCFYIAPSHRRTGLMAELIRASVTHAFKHGATAVEACPLDPNRKLMWGEGFVGIASTFAAQGFEVVEQRSATRSLVRFQRPAP